MGSNRGAFRYRFGGRARKLTLPGFPGLVQARKLARDALEKLDGGIDPAAEKKAAKLAARALSTGEERDLFATVAKAFIERHAKTQNCSWLEQARLIGLRPADGDAGELVAVDGESSSMGIAPNSRNWPTRRRRAPR